jgi:uncharacterized membrane protein
MVAAKSPRNLLHRLTRAVRARPRVLIAAAVGIVTAPLMPPDWRVATRSLVGWDLGVALYLVLCFRLMTRSDVNRIRRRAAFQDEGRYVFLALVVASALASLGAILAELGGGDEAKRDPLHLALAALTVLLSWAFTHTMFALHYAHVYYDQNAHLGGGLTFPGKDPPDYWDFIYFSFVIGMTSQVSDVAVTSPAIRRTVAAHGVVSFVFNATLLGLTVNLTANAI